MKGSWVEGAACSLDPLKTLLFHPCSPKFLAIVHFDSRHSLFRQLNPKNIHCSLEINAPVSQNVSEALSAT